MASWWVLLDLLVCAACKRSKLACHRNCTVCLVHESGWHNAGWSTRFWISNSRATHMPAKSYGSVAPWLHRTESSSGSSMKLRLWVTAFNRFEPFFLGLKLWNQGTVFCSIVGTLLCWSCDNLPAAFTWPVKMFHKKYLMGTHWHSLCFEWVLLLSKHLESNLMEKKEHYLPLVIGTEYLYS